MSVEEPGDVFDAWSCDSASAPPRHEIVYAELRRLARGKLSRDTARYSLSATDVVHEVYIRLAQQHTVWHSRDQFFAMASRMMRRVLVDHARARRARKRLGVTLQLDDDHLSHLSAPAAAVDVVALNVALEALAVRHPRQARLVDLHFFKGLSLDETAAALSVSLATANRDWKFAKRWLRASVAAGSLRRAGNRELASSAL